MQRQLIYFSFCAVCVVRRRRRSFIFLRFFLSFWLSCLSFIALRCAALHCHDCLSLLYFNTQTQTHIIWIIIGNHAISRATLAPAAEHEFNWNRLVCECAVCSCAVCLAKRIARHVSRAACAIHLSLISPISQLAAVLDYTFCTCLATRRHTLAHVNRNRISNGTNKPIAFLFYAISIFNFFVESAVRRRNRNLVKEEKRQLSSARHGHRWCISQQQQRRRQQKKANAMSTIGNKR